MTELAWDLLWKLWYPVLTRLTRGRRVAFLNYGYAGDPPDPDGPTLGAADEADRVCIQLYDRVVGGTDVAGRRVLEVSCGHGGGASYVARYRNPGSVLGVDRNARAIERCRALHAVDGLAFAVGDAAALGVADASVDAVLNVEASHCYADVPRFFGEVRRVLRPGGHFLYADFRRDGTDLAAVRSQVAASGLDVVRCQDISRNVVRGMELNTDRSLALIRAVVPRPLRRLAMSFAGVRGSPIYRRLKSGETIYFLYALRKPLPAATDERGRPDGADGRT